MSPKHRFDNVPIRLKSAGHSPIPRPFHLEQAWCSVEHFPDLNREWWSTNSFLGCGAFILVKKITRIREQLKHWVKFDFGLIKLEKLVLLYELDLFDVCKESRPLSIEEYAKDSSFKIGVVLDSQIVRDLLEAEG